MSSDSLSIEDSLNKAYEDLSKGCTVKYAECEDKIRRAPIASVLFAAAAGYILNFLPLFSLLNGLIRLLLFLIKPALLIFGTLKLVEFAKKQSARSAGDFSERDPVLDSSPGA